jgi:F0F1-type ATP synthase assembly protein I
MSNRKGDKHTSFQQLSSLLGIGMVFPISIVIGYGIGYYLDQWLGTTYLKVVFLLFGIASGFVSFFRSIAQLEREEKANSDPPK